MTETTNNDKVWPRLVGSIIAIGGLAGLLLDRIDGPSGLGLVTIGVGVGFTPRFVAAVRAKLNGGKK